MSREEFDAGYRGSPCSSRLSRVRWSRDVPRSRVGAALAATLRAEARRAGGIFLALVAVTVVAQLLTLAGPFLIGRAVDELGGSAATADDLALGVAGVVVATWLVGAARGSRRCGSTAAGRAARAGVLRPPALAATAPRARAPRTGDLMGRMEASPSPGWR